MIGRARAAIGRAGRGVARRCREFRDLVEWRAARVIRQDAPWSRNRWGQRYQAGSLAEYHYLRDGNPETFESALIERVLRPGMTVVDVGANHGLFTLEASLAVGPEGLVHAFEPTPTTRDLLRKNLDANRIGNVRVHPEALGESPGTARLRVHHDLSGLNTLAASEIEWNRRTLVADAIVEVAVETLDHLTEDGRIGRLDFLKIDVEGFELAVLRGARGLLEARRIDRIMLEVGDVTCRNAGIDPAEVLTELESVGYQLHPIWPDGEVGDRIRALPTAGFSANFVATPQEG